MYEPYEEKLLNVTRHFAGSMSAEKSIVLLYWKKVEMLQKWKLDASSPNPHVIHSIMDDI